MLQSTIDSIVWEVDVIAGLNFYEIDLSPISCFPAKPLYVKDNWEN